MNVGGRITGTAAETEESRYDPAYYQEPEELYPAGKDKTVRSAEFSLEDYVVNALENLVTEIDISDYEIPAEEAKVSSVVYEPECPEGQLIFGFTVRGSQLCYALHGRMLL